MYRLLLSALIASTQGMEMDKGMKMDNLNVTYEWKMLEYVYPTETAKLDAQRTRTDIPEYSIPTGLEVYEDRLFLAIPRLRRGVAATLAYINISDTRSVSPRLRPYPSWEANKLRPDDPPEIVSTFKIRADRCGRLWVLDSGFVDVLESTIKQLVKPRLLIYDLRSNQLVRSYTIPDSQTHQNDSGFVNIAVEDEDCQDTFAYMADVFGPGLVVYSYKENRSWLVKHHYFNFSPLAGNMTIGGVEFMNNEGLFGLALSRADDEGYSTLYFHPLVSFNEFSVSTRVLRDEDLATNSSANFHQFKMLGTRGEKGQSGASYLDKKSNVIFFASIHLDAVICWRATNTNYTTVSHSRVFMNNETMVYPSDIKVDANDTLWVLSNKLPVFMHRNLDYNTFNFRILSGKVADAIKGTACDSKMVVNKTIVDKIKGVFKKDKAEPSSSSRNYDRVFALPLLVVLVVVAMCR